MAAAPTLHRATVPQPAVPDQARQEVVQRDALQEEEGPREPPRDREALQQHGSAPDDRHAGADPPSDPAERFRLRPAIEPIESLRERAQQEFKQIWDLCTQMH